MIRILLISDIHGNFPALRAIEDHFSYQSFDYTINCGDSLVYGPFPNETLAWLESNAIISILGNTDKKVIKLLRGKSFNKPSNPDKRIMYTWTADQLNNMSKSYLLSLKYKDTLKVASKAKGLKRSYKIGIYHGSPERPHEFLFNTTSDQRFLELSSMCAAEVIVCGHSHDPFYKMIGDRHFINPGSVGRMFDGNPQASCAILEFTAQKLMVYHYRISYDIKKTIKKLRQASLPAIYEEMYKLGKKTN
jgi:putative phosphoesterase